MLRVLTIAPTGHRDEETIAIVLDANGQGILRYIVATGYGLLLETIVGEGKVQLIPAIALLQLVGSLTHSQQEQQRQDALQLEQHVVDWAGTRLGIHLHNWPKKKRSCFPFWARVLCRAGSKEALLVLVTWNSARAAGALVTVAIMLRTRFI